MEELLPANGLEGQRLRYPFPYLALCNGVTIKLLSLKPPARTYAIPLPTTLQISHYPAHSKLVDANALAGNKVGQLLIK